MASPLILSFFFLSFFYWLKRVKQKTNQNWNRRGVYWRRSISWVLNVKHSDVRVLKLLRSKRKLVKCRRKKKEKKYRLVDCIPAIKTTVSITPHHPILSLSLSLSLSLPLPLKNCSFSSLETTRILEPPQL